MSGRAKSKYIRMGSMKINLVLDKIRGKRVDDAYKTLMFINKRAVDPIKKTLEAAVANGAAKDITDKVKVVKAWVGQGPSLKRMRPRAMGRANIYKRPSSHIEIEIA